MHAIVFSKTKISWRSADLLASLRGVKISETFWLACHKMVAVLGEPVTRKEYRLYSKVSNCGEGAWSIGERNSKDWKINTGCSYIERKDDAIKSWNRSSS